MRHVIPQALSQRLHQKAGHNRRSAVEVGVALQRHPNRKLVDAGLFVRDKDGVKQMAFDVNADQADRRNFPIRGVTARLVRNYTVQDSITG